MNKQLSIIIDTVSEAKTEVLSYTEQAVDLATDNEFLENVPLVEHATKIKRILDIYKKNKLKRNYLAFIESVRKMNDEQITSYKKILFANEETAVETAETVFEIIVESEKPLKAKLIGNLSVALANKEISLKDYNTLALIIQPASIAALRALPDFLASNNNNIKTVNRGAYPDMALLLSLGIASVPGESFVINRNGQILAIHGFGLEVNGTITI